MSNPAVKKKPRGKPFTGADDPRRKPGGGRPKNENSLTYWLRKKMDEVLSDGRTQAEVLAETIVLEALKGDARMVSLLWDRTEGKVAEQIKLSGAVSLYEQGASQGFDKKLLLAAMKRLSGAK